MRAAFTVAATLLACSTPAPAQTPPPSSSRTATFSAAAYAKHVKALAIKLAAHQLGELEIQVEDPFVVIGSDLATRAQTVRWAADHLEHDFFTKRPGMILDIYLFGDADSYTRGVQSLTGEAPTTPYGFYSSTHHALFMNIATGGGTLVHEIVHPYVDADLPNPPPWLNEGLGSLFEQSAERDGHIVGLTNWRLAGLQHAIARHEVPTLQALTHLDPAAFYDDDTGVHYAASRYLLYYLQEHGLLHDFYRAARAAHTTDPTGYATLVATLGEHDMADFEARWQRYVAQLTFP